jgi:hypothetical protein
MITASRLAREHWPELAARQTPASPGRCRHYANSLPTRCIACGEKDVPGRQGESVRDLIGDSSNEYHMYGPGRCLCDDCLSAHDRLAMNRLTNVCITGDRIYSFQAWNEANPPERVSVIPTPADKVRFLLNIPAERFVLAFKDLSQGNDCHIIWKCRVNFSPRRWHARVGDAQVFIDTDELKDVLDFLKAAKRESRAFAQHLASRSAGSLWNHSYPHLERFFRGEPGAFLKVRELRENYNPDFARLFGRAKILSRAWSEYLEEEA